MSSHGQPKHTPKRKPAGRPDGGQFAEHGHSDPDIGLSDDLSGALRTLSEHLEAQIGADGERLMDCIETLASGEPLSFDQVVSMRAVMKSLEEAAFQEKYPTQRMPYSFSINQSAEEPLYILADRIGWDPRQVRIVKVVDYDDGSEYHRDDRWLMVYGRSVSVQGAYRAALQELMFHHLNDRGHAADISNELPIDLVSGAFSTKGADVESVFRKYGVMPVSYQGPSVWNETFDVTHVLPYDTLEELEESMFYLDDDGGVTIRLPADHPDAS